MGSPRVQGRMLQQKSPLTHQRFWRLKHKMNIRCSEGHRHRGVYPWDSPLGIIMSLLWKKTQVYLVTGGEWGGGAAGSPSA